MSDRLITAEEAQKRLSELEAMSDWTGEDRIAAEYARTVIAQAEQVETLSRLLTGAEKSTIERAEQIKRLQAALREAEVKRRQVWVEMGADIDPHGAVDWETQYDALTAEDMEADDA